MVDVFSSLKKNRGKKIYHAGSQIYETTFGNITFDWIESHSQSVNCRQVLGLLSADMHTSKPKSMTQSRIAGLTVEVERQKHATIKHKQLAY